MNLKTSMVEALSTATNGKIEIVENCQDLSFSVYLVYKTTIEEPSPEKQFDEKVLKEIANDFAKQIKGACIFADDIKKLEKQVEHYKKCIRKITKKSKMERADRDFYRGVKSMIPKVTA